MNAAPRPPAAKAWRWRSSWLLLLAGACGGPQDPSKLGATCFRDDDCKAGLICVAPGMGDTDRVCSDDPTPLISNVEGPPVMEQGGAAVVAGAPAIAGGGMAPVAGTSPSSGSANGGSAAGSGGGGTGGGGLGGTGGSAAAGTGGSDTAGSAGTDPVGGAPA